MPKLLFILPVNTTLIEIYNCYKLKTMCDGYIQLKQNPTCVCLVSKRTVRQKLSNEKNHIMSDLNQRHFAYKANAIPRRYWVLCNFSENSYDLNRHIFFQVFPDSSFVHFSLVIHTCWLCIDDYFLRIPLSIYYFVESDLQILVCRFRFTK